MSEEKKASTATDKRLTIIGIVICVLLAPILIFNVILIVKGYVTDEVPSIGGIIPQIVLSPSMEPEIMQGDLIIARSTTADKIKEGDVISFYDPTSKAKMVVTHKVGKIIDDGDGTISFRTYGIHNDDADGNHSYDPDPCPEENLIGIYRGTRFKGLGNVAIFLQSVPGLIVCIAVPLVLFVGVDLYRRNKYYQETKSDNDVLIAELKALRAEKEAREKEQDSDGKSE